MISDNSQSISNEQFDVRKLKVAFFGYAWNLAGNIDGYMAQHVEKILDLGVDIDLYLGNQFTDRRGVVGIHFQISPSRLAAHIKRQGYDFTLSFNNSMLMPKVVDALDCQPVSVIVDSEQHLFDYAERGGYSALDFDIQIASIYRSLEQDIAATCPHALGRFHFIPPATDTQSWRNARSDGETETVNVSWIASLVGDHFLDQLTEQFSQDHHYSGTLAECLEKVSNSGYLGDLKSRSDVLEFCQSIRWEVDFLEVHLQNIATNNDRTAAVEELWHRGLSLYGNDRWNILATHNRPVAQSLMVGRKISTHEAQMDVYNGSRISINVPQIQAKTGLQYRVLDVMASRALLLTKHIDGSDLDAVFRGNFPVPRFKTVSDLGKFVDHYLANDSERHELVEACHGLLGPDLSFGERVRDYLTLSNRDAAAYLPPRLPYGQAFQHPRGTLNRISSSSFTNWTGDR